MLIIMTACGLSPHLARLSATSTTALRPISISALSDSWLEAAREVCHVLTLFSLVVVLCFVFLFLLEGIFLLNLLFCHVLAPHPPLNLRGGPALALALVVGCWHLIIIVGCGMCIESRPHDLVARAGGRALVAFASVCLWRTAQARTPSKPQALATPHFHAVGIARGGAVWLRRRVFCLGAAPLMAPAGRAFFSKRPRIPDPPGRLGAPATANELTREGTQGIRMPSSIVMPGR